MPVDIMLVHDILLKAMNSNFLLSQVWVQIGRHPSSDAQSYRWEPACQFQGTIRSSIFTTSASPNSNSDSVTNVLQRPRTLLGSKPDHTSIPTLILVFSPNDGKRDQSSSPIAHSHEPKEQLTLSRVRLQGILPRLPPRVLQFSSRVAYWKTLPV